MKDIPRIFIIYVFALCCVKAVYILKIFYNKFNKYLNNRNDYINIRKNNYIFILNIYNK